MAFDILIWVQRYIYYFYIQIKNQKIKKERLKSALFLFFFSKIIKKKAIRMNEK